jgi:hypothetical protein
MKETITMGIVHFAPVGTSPGAVTSALAYLNRHPEQKGQAGGDIVQDIVIFCSHQVDAGTRPADDYIWNGYGRTGQRQGWQAPRGRQNTIDVIKAFLAHPQEGAPLPPKGALYVWPVDVNDYWACFEVIAKATLATARSDDTGKYVWANLTGGTNILNSALMQVASLSGLIGRAYYTFIGRDAERAYLQPPGETSRNYAFNFVPLVKTTYDVSYYRVLEYLDPSPETWVWGRDLLGRLKQQYPAEFTEAMTFDHFKNQYLNRMTNDVLAEDRDQSQGGDRPVKITPKGSELMQRIHLDELIQALINRDTAHAGLVKTYQAELKRYQR